MWITAPLGSIFEYYFNLSAYRQIREPKAEFFIFDLKSGLSEKRTIELIAHRDTSVLNRESVIGKRGEKREYVSILVRSVTLGGLPFDMTLNFISNRLYGFSFKTVSDDFEMKSFNRKIPLDKETKLGPYTVIKKVVIGGGADSVYSYRVADPRYEEENEVWLFLN